MKNLIYLLLLCCLTILTALKCKKPQPATTSPDQLPAITTEGKNTFGCYVNGQLFIGKGGFNIYSISASFKNNIFNVSANYLEPKKQSGAGFDYKQNIVLNALGSSSSILNDTVIATFTDILTLKTFQTNNVQKGELNFLRVDSINRIISGTFYFNAIASDSTKVSVTDGRFDLQY